MDRIFVPRLQFRSKAIVRYYEPVPGYRYNHDRTNHEKLFSLLGPNSPAMENENINKARALAYSGEVSKGARKRIAKAVTLLSMTSPRRWIWNPVTGKKFLFKLSFVTLTISASDRNLTAREAHKLVLEPFLRTLRRKYGATSYIWKAELQKRGQIHYHITTNVFIHHKTLRDDWNKLQDKAGLLDNYAKRHGHKNPNSTDIHAVKNINDIEAYLVKYLSKVGEKTDGKVWDCSKNLKENKYFLLEEDTATTERINELIAAGKGKVIELERCTLFKFESENYRNTILGEWHRINFRKWVALISKKKQTK